jgi:hypothetical protein
MPAAHLLLRIKIITASKKYFWLGFVFDPEEARLLEVIAVAGTRDEFRDPEMEPSVHGFQSWVQSMRYYQHFDSALTLDIEGFGRSMGSNPDFVNRALPALNSRNFAAIEPFFSAELDHAIGEKERRIEFSVLGSSDQAEEPDAPAAESVAAVPVKFVMAPVNGIPLIRLHPGLKAVVKVTDFKHPLGRAFAERWRKANGELPGQLPALIQAMNQLPEGKIQVLVVLPDSSIGEAIEESENIKIKLIASRKKKAAPSDPLQLNKADGMKIVFIVGGIFVLLVAAALILFFS